MRRLKLSKAQSLIEYAVLSAVVISAFLLLQAIVKRGVSGGINEAASRMGEQYSVTNTTTKESRTMAPSRETGKADQYIVEETGTSTADGTLGKALTAVGMGNVAVLGSINNRAHNITQRLDQNFISTTESKTDAASQEQYKVGTFIGSCLLSGTPILMSDGSFKPIQEVKVGDKILAFDEKTSGFKEDKVVKFFKHRVDRYLIINNKFKVTSNHLVYSEGRFVNVGSLKVGDKLLNSEAQPEKIVSIKEKKKSVWVYNLEVNPYHTYIAGGFVVHNKPQ